MAVRDSSSIAAGMGEVWCGRGTIQRLRPLDQGVASLSKTNLSQPVPRHVLLLKAFKIIHKQGAKHLRHEYVEAFQI